MGQGRVAALALPLPATNRQKVSPVRAVDPDCHRRDKGAGIAGTCRAASAGEGLFEELAHLAIGIGKVAGGGIAMVGGDYQSSSGGQSLDKGPEVIAAQLFGCVTGQRVEALAGARAIVNFAVRPVMPE